MNAEPPWRNQDYPDCNLQRDTKFCINILRTICHWNYSLIYNHIIHKWNRQITFYVSNPQYLYYFMISMDMHYKYSWRNKNHFMLWEGVWKCYACPLQIWIVTVWILINEKSSNVSTKCENISSLSHINVFVNRFNTLSSSDFDSNNGMNNSSWKSFFYQMTFQGPGIILSTF